MSESYNDNSEGKPTKAKYPTAKARLPDIDVVYQNNDLAYRRNDSAYQDNEFVLASNGVANKGAASFYQGNDVNYSDVNSIYRNNDVNYTGTDAVHPSNNMKYSGADAVRLNNGANYTETDAARLNNGANYTETEAIRHNNNVYYTGTDAAYQNNKAAHHASNVAVADAASFNPGNPGANVNYTGTEAIRQNNNVNYTGTDAAYQNNSVNYTPVDAVNPNNSVNYTPVDAAYQNNKATRQAANVAVANVDTIYQHDGVNMQDKKAAKKKRGIYEIISDVLFFIAVLVVMVSLITYFKDDTAKTFMGYSWFTVISSSMQDEIPQDSLILTHYTDPLELKAGDNITFFRGKDATVTHKIVDIYENYQDSGLRGFQTKGVNNVNVDLDIVSEENVIGKVMFSIPVVGAAVAYMGANIHFVFIVFGLFTIFFIALRLLLNFTRLGVAAK